MRVATEPVGGEVAEDTDQPKAQTLGNVGVAMIERLRDIAPEAAEHVASGKELKAISFKGMVHKFNAKYPFGLCSNASSK